MFAGENTADLLVGGVFLVGAGRVAVEGEERLLRIIDSEVAFADVFDNVCTAEITSDAGVDADVGDVARCDGPVGMIAQYFFYDGLSHDFSMKNVK